MAVSVSDKLIKLAAEMNIQLTETQAQELVRANQGKSAKQLLKIFLNQPRKKPELSDDPEIRRQQLLRETRIEVFHLCNKFIDAFPIFKQEDTNIPEMMKADHDAPKFVERIGVDVDEHNFKQVYADLAKEGEIYAYWLIRNVAIDLYLRLEVEARYKGFRSLEFCTAQEVKDYRLRQELGQIPTLEDYMRNQMRGITQQEVLTDGNVFFFHRDKGPLA